jgi:hypothetical protein
MRPTGYIYAAVFVVFQMIISREIWKTKECTRGLAFNVVCAWIFPPITWYTFLAKSIEKYNINRSVSGFISLIVIAYMLSVISGFSCINYQAYYTCLFLWFVIPLILTIRILKTIIHEKGSKKDSALQNDTPS